MKMAQYLNAEISKKKKKNLNQAFWILKIGIILLFSFIESLIACNISKFPSQKGKNDQFLLFIANWLISEMPTENSSSFLQHQGP